MTKKTNIKITKKDFMKYISSFKDINISHVNDNDVIKFSNDISNENLIKHLTYIYDYENLQKKVNILCNLKNLSLDKLIDAFKYALSREDLKDPLMLLNIIDIIKTDNTLDDSFFENENIFISSIDDMLDLRRGLKLEIKTFKKQLSIYFLSLFKTYNKTHFTPSDNVVELPNIYNAIMLSTDLSVISGIFATSESFNTNECIYIKDAYKYISNMMMKNAISMAFFKEFVENNNISIWDNLKNKIKKIFKI